MTFYVTVASDFCEPQQPVGSFRLRFPQTLFFTSDKWTVAVLDYCIKAQVPEVNILCDLILPEIFGSTEAKLLLSLPTISSAAVQISVPRFKSVALKQVHFLNLQFVDRTLTPIPTNKIDNFLLTLAFTKL